jgi:hypothetical protein
VKVTDGSGIVVELLDAIGTRATFPPGTVAQIVVAGCRFSPECLLHLAMSSGEPFVARRVGDTVQIVVRHQAHQPIPVVSNGHKAPRGGGET